MDEPSSIGQSGRTPFKRTDFADSLLRAWKDDVLRAADNGDIQYRVEEDFADFFVNGSVALHWIGPDGIILGANRRELELLGYHRDEYLGRHIAEFHVNQQAIADILKRLSSGEVLNGCEAQLRCRDGSIRDVLISSSVLWDNARFVHARCFTIDITERKQAERSQQLLVEELKHRVRNTLATVQAIAIQTLHQTPADERAVFLARLRALAAAHDLLTQANGDRVPMSAIAGRALEAFQEDGRDRFRVDGPDAWINGNKAIMLTMVIHELATNSAKYGALSAPQGSVCVAWSLSSSGDLHVRWVEDDGPAVSFPATRGFGTGLIEGVVRGDLDGELSFDWRSAGLGCEFSISREHIVQKPFHESAKERSRKNDHV